MSIEAARTRDGGEPVEEYLQKLERSPGHGRRNEAKLATILIRFEDFASTGYLEQPRELNHLQDEIWEIKAGVSRLPFFYVNDEPHGRVIRLTNGFDKKEEITPVARIRRAVWVRDQDAQWHERSGDEGR
jgi:hypothetical protein